MKYDDVIEELEYFVETGLNENAFYLTTPKKYLDENCFDFRDGRHSTAGNVSASDLDKLSGDALINAINKLTKEHSSEEKIPAGLSRFIRKHGLYNKFAIVLREGEKYSTSSLESLAKSFKMQKEALED